MAYDKDFWAKVYRIVVDAQAFQSEEFSSETIDFENLYRETILGIAQRRQQLLRALPNYVQSWPGGFGYSLRSATVEEEESKGPSEGSSTGRSSVNNAIGENDSSDAFRSSFLELTAAGQDYVRVVLRSIEDNIDISTFLSRLPADVISFLLYWQIVGSENGIPLRG